MVAFSENEYICSSLKLISNKNFKPWLIKFRKIAPLAVPALMNALLMLFLKVISIRSTRMYAPIAALVQMCALLRPFILNKKPNIQKELPRRKGSFFYVNIFSV
jgi:hypothetical protein